MKLTKESATSLDGPDWLREKRMKAWEDFASSAPIPYLRYGLSITTPLAGMDFEDLELGGNSIEIYPNKNAFVERIMYTLATTDDLDALVSFLEQPSVDLTFIKPLSQRSYSIKDRVYNKYRDGYWILAKLDNKIIGCLALIPTKEEIEISTYAVDRECRGRGIGSALIDIAIETTIEKYPTNKTLILDSWEGNPAIDKLMQKSGFVLRESFEDPAKRPQGIKTVVYSIKLD